MRKQIREDVLTANRSETNTLDQVECAHAQYFCGQVLHVHSYSACRKLRTHHLCKGYRLTFMHTTASKSRVFFVRHVLDSAMWNLRNGGNQKASIIRLMDFECMSVINKGLEFHILYIYINISFRI